MAYLSGVGFHAERRPDVTVAGVQVVGDDVAVVQVSRLEMTSVHVKHYIIE